MRWQYQSKAEPISTSPESVSLDRWSPVYPDTIRQVSRLAVAILAGSCFLGDIPRAEATSIDRWNPTYPNPQQRAKGRIQPEGIVNPFTVTTPEVVTLDKWLPTYLIRLDKSKRVFWEGISVSDLTTPVTLDRWLPTYPIRLDRAKRVFWDGISVTNPRPIQTLDSWSPTYPDYIPRVRKRVFWQGEFTTDPRETVTLDRWLPTYPIRLSPKSRIFVESTTIDPYFSHIPVTEIITIDKWLPIYPIRLDPKTRVFWQGGYQLNPLPIPNVGGLLIVIWTECSE